jgi:hypothetical protein
VKTVELLREEVWSKDKRIIAAGATEWPELIPLQEAGTENGLPKQIGFITNIRREGDRILGDSSIKVEAVGVGGFPSEADSTELGATFTRFRILYAIPCTKTQYMWND